MTFKENGLSAFRISLLAAAVGTSGHAFAQDENNATRKFRSPLRGKGRRDLTMATRRNEA